MSFIGGPTDEEFKILLPQLEFLQGILPVFNGIFEVFCVLFNFLHLAVLFQKSLRTNAVYIIMIEIAIFEIIYFLQAFTARVYDIYHVDLYQDVCLRPSLLLIQPFQQIWKIISNISRRMFVWLMVQLALIRTLSISFPMSNWITKPSTTLMGSLVVMLLWFGFQYWPMFLVRVYWKPDVLQSEKCKSYPPERHAADPVFIFAIPSEYGVSYNNMAEDKEGLIRLITVIVYTFLVLVLVVKLWLINLKRKKMNSTEKSDNSTTTLIIVMTITFLISEGFFAALMFFDFYTELQHKGRFVLFGNKYGNSAEDFSRTLRVLNSASHAVICYFMSSQYKETVHKMMCCSMEKKKVSFIQVSMSTDRDKQAKKKTESSY